MTAPLDAASDARDGAAGPLAEVIRTERLDLLPLSLDFCEAILAGDRARASMLLGHKVGEWPEGGELAFALPAYAANLRRDPLVAEWQGRAVVVRETGAVAGSANLKGRPRNGRAEVGYGLLEAYRGRGYAREAARALVAHAFADPATAEVVAVIDPTNARSIRVAESLGMHRTGELSSHHPGSYVWAVGRAVWANVAAAREG